MAKNDCLLSQQSNRFVEVWLYLTNLANVFSTHFYRRKILFVHGTRLKLIAKNFKNTLEIHLSFSEEKQLLMNRLIETQQTSKSFVGIDASQLYPNLICQPMPTGIYTLCHLGSENKYSHLVEARPVALKK